MAPRPRPRPRPSEKRPPPRPGRRRPREPPGPPRSPRPVAASIPRRARPTRQYCGWTMSCTTLKQWETIVGIYSGIIPRVFFGGAGFCPSTVRCLTKRHKTGEIRATSQGVKKMISRFKSISGSQKTTKQFVEMFNFEAQPVLTNLDFVDV